jgi:hypothetical protein
MKIDEGIERMEWKKMEGIEVRTWRREVQLFPKPNSWQREYGICPCISKQILDLGSFDVLIILSLFMSCFPVQLYILSQFKDVYNIYASKN